MMEDPNFFTMTVAFLAGVYSTYLRSVYFREKWTWFSDTFVAFCLTIMLMAQLNFWSWIVALVFLMVTYGISVEIEREIRK